VKVSTRAVAAGDESQLLHWRNRAAVREMSIASDPIDEGNHSVWFEQLLSGPHEHIRVVALDNRDVGLIRLEGLDLHDGIAGWGCHMGSDEVPPGFGATLPVLSLALGFERFELRRMIAEVIEPNANMRAVHRRLGIPLEGTRRQALRRTDGPVDVYEYGILRSEWADVRSTAARLLPMAMSEAVASAIDALASGSPKG
jgi:RimJ/RimL family protein N-acetyltransferase